MKSIFIGAYWGKREESRDQCAVRVSRLLTSLSTKNPLLQHWYFKAYSKKKALETPVCNDINEVSKYFKTNNHDIGGQPIHDLGFRISMWNGDNNMPISLSISCGKYSESVKNSVVLDFFPMDQSHSLAAESVLKNILDDIIEIFDPDDAMVSGDEYLSEENSDEGLEFDGWIKYKKCSGEGLYQEDPIW